MDILNSMDKTKKEYKDRVNIKKVLKQINSVKPEKLSPAYVAFLKDIQQYFPDSIKDHDVRLFAELYFKALRYFLCNGDSISIPGYFKGARLVFRKNNAVVTKSHSLISLGGEEDYEEIYYVE